MQTPRLSDRAEVALAAIVGVALFGVAWKLLHVGFYERDVISDIGVYREYGNRIEKGDVPYADFRVEYPPGALPAFAIPSLIEDGYVRWFERLMLASGAAALVSAALALAGVGAGRVRLFAAVAFAAAAPLALGSVILSRYDLWPAAVTLAALAALVGERHRLGAALLGLGIVVKVYPAVLVPLALAWAWRRRGAREARWSLGIVVAVVLAAYVPFAIVGFDGVVASLGRQLSRPLQIESLGAAFLLALHHLGWAQVTMESGSGSQNLVGPGTTVAAVLTSLLQLAAVVAIWIDFARDRTPTRERLVLCCAAAVVAFVALGKVLSPQFLIWLIPLVPLVAGRRGVAASLVLAAALVLTQVWFPFRYWDFALELDETMSWLVLARDLTLIALLVVLWPGRADPVPEPRPG